MNVYLSNKSTVGENWNLLQLNPKKATTKELEDCLYQGKKMAFQIVICAVAVVALGILAATYVDWKLGLAVVGLALLSVVIIKKKLVPILKNVSQKIEIARIRKKELIQTTIQHVTIDQNNVKTVFGFSKQYGVQSKAASCAQFIGKTFENDIQELKKLLLQPDNSEELKWQFLIHASKNSQDTDFAKLLQDQEISEEAKDILRLGMKCSEWGIKPSFTDVGVGRNDFGSPCVELVQLYIIRSYQEEEAQQLLTEINKKFGIKGLKVDIFFIKQDDLEKIALLMPDLHYLYIRNDNVTKLPDVWLKSLKVMDCRTCENFDTKNFDGTCVIDSY